MFVLLASGQFSGANTFGPFGTWEQAVEWGKANINPQDTFTVMSLQRPGTTYLSCSPEAVTDLINYYVKDGGEAYVTVEGANWVVRA